MLCIASFLVFLLLGIFSVTHRQLAAKAWYCIVRKLTLRPCDIHFNEELKGHLLGTIIFTHPRLARWLDRWVDWIAFIFVVLSLWSLFAVAMSGLNLVVYDTCNPHEAESCSLGGEACGIGSGQLSWWEGVTTGQPHVWLWGHVETFGVTVSRLPHRFRNWDAEQWIYEDATYYRNVQEQPLLVEIIDPSCRYCAQQFRRFQELSIEERARVTYLLYPIPNHREGGYIFPHSLRLSVVITALRSTHPGQDWEFLQLLFAERTSENVYYYEAFGVTPDGEIEALLATMLEQLALTPIEQQRVLDVAMERDSTAFDGYATVVRTQQVLLDKEAYIQKIPTIFFQGRRYDRFVEQL